MPHAHRNMVVANIIRNNLFYHSLVAITDLLPYGYAINLGHGNAGRANTNPDDLEK